MKALKKGFNSRESSSSKSMLSFIGGNGKVVISVFSANEAIGSAISSRSCWMVSGISFSIVFSNSSSFLGLVFSCSFSSF